MSITPRNYNEPSVFTPESLLREARRQKHITEGNVPKVCILDPDGDIVHNLTSAGLARLNPYWACYHTQMYDFTYEGMEFGIVGNVVGSSFAVLVAEEMFASGCELLLSMTSAGQIISKGTPPYFVLIESALRDEGTSYHYLPPADFSTLNRALLERMTDAFRAFRLSVFTGSTWTTDAPFRETETAIEHSRSLGIFGVEMEAAALYAFAEAKDKPIVCFAHITNQMGSVENDFEKGEAMGSVDALEVLSHAAKTWRGSI